MARIAYVEKEQATEKTRDILNKNHWSNIFRMLGHSESHLYNYCRLGNAIRFKGELDPGLREIAITRTGILCHSDYEVMAHQRLCAAAGVSPEKIGALEQGAEADVFSDVEKEVLRFTDDVVKNDRAGDETFNVLVKRLTPGALVELHLAIGFYIMTSKFLLTFDIDLQS
ncbi:MAG: carboxymuconolactone decarboxylase family protein [Deltaproteobacteria bacterium]|nr:carboxymuconolactone decarboxylase family protein [Deltaproteobacteria bacterium]